jgi:hypothetical protein
MTPKLYFTCLLYFILYRIIEYIVLTSESK